MPRIALAGPLQLRYAQLATAHGFGSVLSVLSVAHSAETDPLRRRGPIAMLCAIQSSCYAGIRNSLWMLPQTIF